jgi:predicted amidohydrolase YtcJ
MWPGAKSTRLGELPPDTVMLIDFPASNTHWMEPRDVTLEEAVQAITRGSDHGMSHAHSAGIICVTVSGDIRVIDKDINPADLRELLTVKRIADR